MRSIALIAICWAQFVLAQPHEQLLQLRNQGQPLQALQLLEGKPTDMGIAMALSAGELLLAQRGPLGLKKYLDDLRLDPSDPFRLCFDALRHASAQQTNSADSLLIALSRRDGLNPLDALFLTRQRMIVNLRNPGVLEASPFDSLLAWTRTHLPKSEGLREHFLLLCQLGDARQEFVRGMRDAAAAGADEVALRSHERSQGLVELEARVFIALKLSRTVTARIEAWTHVASLAEDLSELRMQALARNFRGYAYAESGNSPAAIRDWDAALPVFESLGDINGAAWNRVSYGWHQLQRGEIDAAETALSTAHDHFVTLRSRQGLALALIDLGVLYAVTEQLEEALSYFQEALDLAVEDQDFKAQSDLLNNIGGVRQRSGDAEGAIRHYEQGLEIADRIGDPLRAASRLGNLALSSMSLGHIAQAELFYEEAVDRSRSAGQSGAHALVNWASGLISIGELERAQLKLDAVDPYLAKEGAQTRANYLLERGRLQLGLGQTRRAIVSLDSANAWFRNLHAPKLQLPGLVLLANAYCDVGQPEQALRIADEMEAIPSASSSRFSQLVAANARSRAQYSLGERDEALRQARRAVELYVEVRDAFEFDRFGQGESQEAILARPGVQAFQNFVAAADPSSTTCDPALREEAFDLLQQIKSSSLLDRLGRASLRVRPNVAPELTAQLRQSKARLRHLLEIYEAEPADSLRARVANAEAALHRARSELLRADPNYQKASTVSVAKLLTLQPLLDEETLILDFFVPDVGEAMVFTIDRNQVHARSLGDTETLRQSVEFMLRLVEHPSPSIDETALRLVLNKLSQRLLHAIEPAMRNSQRLLICPDGVLHRLPFALLLADGEFLVERYEVNVVPSLGLLAAAERSGDAPPPVHDIAIWLASTSLSHARAEAESIRSHFANCRLFRAKRRIDTFDELQRSEMLGSARILHFIAHGEFDEQRPWNSGIILADASGTTSSVRLDATDLYALDFSADLVCLAACETARGSGVSGLGVQSFAHALLGSGARSIMASLWRVDDAFTALFTLRFYTELSQGFDKATALARAQRHFLTQERWSHPYYWAAFELLGDGDATIALHERGRLASAAWWFLLALVLLLLAIVARV